MQKLIVNSILKQVSDNDKPSLIVSYGGTSILNTSVVRPIYFTATSKYPNIEKNYAMYGFTTSIPTPYIGITSAKARFF